MEEKAKNLSLDGYSARLFRELSEQQPATRRARVSQSLQQLDISVADLDIWNIYTFSGQRISIPQLKNTNTLGVSSLVL